MGEAGWVSSLGGLQQSPPVGCKCLQRQTELLEQGTALACLSGSGGTCRAANPGMLQSIPAEAQPVLLPLLSHPAPPRKTVPSRFIFM